MKKFFRTLVASILRAILFVICFGSLIGVIGSLAINHWDALTGAFILVFVSSLVIVLWDSLTN